MLVAEDLVSSLGEVDLLSVGVGGGKLLGELDLEGGTVLALRAREEVVDVAVVAVELAVADNELFELALAASALEDLAFDTSLRDEAEDEHLAGEERVSTGLSCHTSGTYGVLLPDPVSSVHGLQIPTKKKKVRGWGNTEGAKTVYCWGFQSESKKITVSAATRLIPTPPARVESKKRRQVPSGALNFSISVRRSSICTQGKALS